MKDYEGDSIGANPNWKPVSELPTSEPIKNSKAPEWFKKLYNSVMGEPVDGRCKYGVSALRTMADQTIILGRQMHGFDKEGNLIFSGLGSFGSSVKMVQLGNAARGMAGDVGEVNTCVQKALEYGKPLDLVNLKEELGDVLWRIVQACDAAGFTLAEVMEANIAKLAKRYPDKDSDYLADEANRNREAERVAISGEEGLSEDQQLVKLALKRGWTRAEDGALQLTNDVSNTWATYWKRIVLDGVAYSVPAYLGNRVLALQMEAEREANQRQSIEVAAEGYPQGGCGFGQPAEALEYPVSSALRDTSVPEQKRCTVCGLKIHRTNETGMCTSCYQRKLGYR